MNTKYLAYIALLAGWLIFCYLLYAKEIYPRLHPPSGSKWPVIEEDLEIPLAFIWGSDIPHAGKGFIEWTDSLKQMDTLRNYLILRSYYFRDEAESIEKGKQLAYRRAEKIIRYLDLSKERIMIEILPEEITADMRTHPFEAIRYEVLVPGDVISVSSDTIEICYPLKDSFNLPGQVLHTLDGWLKRRADKMNDTIHLIGTADGTGISESADVAWERVLVVRNRVLENGWNDQMISVSTGQRNHESAIRNRCVVIYFE